MYRRTFFQKLFRISSSAKSPTSIELKDVSGGNLDAGRNDMNGNLIISERKDQNHIGPKHVDSVSLMRRKRLQLFAETQQFYQDSIMYVHCIMTISGKLCTEYNIPCTLQGVQVQHWSNFARHDLNSPHPLSE